MSGKAPTKEASAERQRSELSSPLPSPSSGVEAARRILGKHQYDNGASAIFDTFAVARALLLAVEALEKMRARDERNSSLPLWYRQQLDAVLWPLCEGCTPYHYPTDETRCTPCPRRAALVKD